MTPATDEGSVSVCLAFGVWCQWYMRAVRIVCIVRLVCIMRVRASCA